MVSPELPLPPTGPHRGILRVANLVLLVGSLACLADCSRNKGENPATPHVPATRPADSALAIVWAARDQVGRTLTYDPSYTPLSYPGGDVAIEKGVCTDVVVRALRNGIQMDLQKLVHEDMKIAFAQSPQQWGLKSPDPNIDHRRVPNLMRFFERAGY